MLERYAPPLVISLFTGFWLFSFYSHFFLVDAHSCWFYDPNLGEHSFSENLTLICYGLAAAACVYKLREAASRLYLMLLGLIAVCFLEEANFGQSLFTSDSLFFDRVQWSLHTRTTLDETLYLYEILGILLVIILPCLLLVKKFKTIGPLYRLPYAIPVLFLAALVILVDNWSPQFFWDRSHIFCTLVPEEIYETLIASSLCYFLALDPFVVNRGDQLPMA